MERIVVNNKRNPQKQKQYTVKLNVTKVKQWIEHNNHGNCQFTKNQGQLKTFDPNSLKYRNPTQISGKHINVWAWKQFYKPILISLNI